MQETDWSDTHWKSSIPDHLVQVTHLTWPQVTEYSDINLKLFMYIHWYDRYLEGVLKVLGISKKEMFI